jgi:hypothetical protein
MNSLETPPGILQKLCDATIAKMSGALGGEAVLRDELTTCRRLAPRCVFIVGFMRSKTSVSLQMLNTDPAALVLGEANFYRRHNVKRFSDWYNARHLSFGNQPTKSSYAPDFVPNIEHKWWEWLAAAALHYECVGDKIALSSDDLKAVAPNSLRSFYESRFFDARYVFLLRNPIDTLLSAMKLLGRERDDQMLRECDAWLCYIQIWADWIRIFPHTLTLIADELGTQSVEQVASFTNLRLNGASVLLDDANTRVHHIGGNFPSLQALRDRLIEIFDLARAAIPQNPALWQAEQKRAVEQNDTCGNAYGSSAVRPRPLGHAWALAEQLRKEIRTKLSASYPLLAIPELALRPHFR